jgi:carbon storage regulator
MLVLSRKPNEGVVVPQVGVILTVLEIRGSRVRLGITAPSDVRVYRREVWERTQPCGVTTEVELELTELSEPG